MSDKSEQNKQFREAVIAYVDYDNELKELNAKKRELTEEKKQLEQFMVEFMTENKHEEVMISDGRLKLAVTTTKGAIKKEYVQERISRFTDQHKAVEITLDIFENRPVTEKKQIKRLGQKKKRKKKAAK